MWKEKKYTGYKTLNAHIYFLSFFLFQIVINQKQYRFTSHLVYSHPMIGSTCKISIFKINLKLITSEKTNTQNG